MAKYASHDLAGFGARLHVATTRKQMKSLCRKLNLVKPNSVGASWLQVDERDGNRVHLVVWIDAPPDILSLVDIVAHEAAHTAATLLDHIGQEARGHDSEVLAYLTGWAAARIWESAA